MYNSFMCLDPCVINVSFGIDQERSQHATGKHLLLPAPKTAKQLAARRNHERVKSILLLAIPDEYLLKFHNVTDAKSHHGSINTRMATLTGQVRKIPCPKTGRKMEFKEKQLVPTFDNQKLSDTAITEKGNLLVKQIWKESKKRSYVDNWQDNAPINEIFITATEAQDGPRGYDCSNDFEIKPVNYALMAISSSSSSSSSDNEVQKCSKQCVESFKTLQKNFDSEREKHSKSRQRNSGYELALRISKNLENLET
ncbi:hypothetical protein Tco_0336810 [Tanacetum coccineum]